MLQFKFVNWRILFWCHEQEFMEYSDICLLATKILSKICFLNNFTTFLSLVLNLMKLCFCKLCCAGLNSFYLIIWGSWILSHLLIHSCESFISFKVVKFPWWSPVMQQSSFQFKHTIFPRIISAEAILSWILL